MRKLLLSCTLILFFTIGFAQNISDITGVWLTPKNRSAIKIFKQGNCYFGKIVWQKDGKDKNGLPKKDIHNPNPKLRNNTLQGLIIMNGLCSNLNNEWIKGNIYNPESGNTYKIKVELKNKTTLKVRGYFGFSFIGKTSVWRRK